jgi:hypothetical protein
MTKSTVSSEAAVTMFAQTCEAWRTYFKFVKKALSANTATATVFGEQWKGEIIWNIDVTQDLLKRLSGARNVEDAFQIQADFSRLIMRELTAAWMARFGVPL